MDRVRLYVEENFLYARDGAFLAVNDSLLQAGVIDSMGVVELIDFIEREYAVTVGGDEITESNLGSLRTIAEFVLAKRGRASERAGS